MLCGFWLKSDSRRPNLWMHWSRYSCRSWLCYWVSNCSIMGGCNWPCSGQKSGKLLSQCQHLPKAFLVKKKTHRKLAIRWKASTLVAITSSEVIKSADIRSWNSDFLSSDRGAEIPVHLQLHVLIESFITSEPKIKGLLSCYLLVYSSLLEVQTEEIPEWRYCIDLHS